MKAQLCVVMKVGRWNIPHGWKQLKCFNTLDYHSNYPHLKSIITIPQVGLLDYDTKKRAEWVDFHPGQIVATVAQMTWARGTEAALRSDEPTVAMKAWYDSLVHHT